MIFSKLKTKLTAMFEKDKLEAQQNQWGFFNENDKDVKIIGYATNLTPDTIAGANGVNADFLITHHDAWDFVYGMKEDCCELLKQYGIIHAFFHAPLDDADFGTSMSLAVAIDLKNCYKVIPYNDIFLCGVIGELEQGISFEKLSLKLSAILKEPIRAYKNNDRLIYRICVVTGGGNLTEDIKIAVDEKCDAYITGEYVLYSQQYAKFKGINLLIGSHTNTEVLGVESMAKRLVAETAVETVRIPEDNY